MRKLPITIIMLSLNEERNLPVAIESVKDWAGEIFIVDSLSTDKTVDIGLEHGVNIVQRPFTNFGEQWNFALERLIQHSVCFVLVMHYLIGWGKL